MKTSLRKKQNHTAEQLLFIFCQEDDGHMRSCSVELLITDDRCIIKMFGLRLYLHEGAHTTQSTDEDSALKLNTNNALPPNVQSRATNSKHSTRLYGRSLVEQCV